MTNPTNAFCAYCGTQLGGGTPFCQACGKPVGQVVPTTVQTTAPELTTFVAIQSALKGRYAVEREVGRGGMATVYLAQDIRHDRRVAIKVLLPELAASVGADRFEREIRVAAKLQHPNILTLYDSGNADGLLYYVMPFVDGESLRHKLDREKMLPVGEALGLVIEVAEALGYAHAQGIVHRDIKPENILLSNGHALVADFGIARAVMAAEGENKLTKTGTAVGTPIYMSPEQAMGDEVGPTADLYSLACMAFELLTGEPPFTGASARAIMARHTMELPPSIRLVRDTVPEEVEEAILWALAKVPADRPKNAAAFIEALATPLAETAPRLSMMRSRLTSAGRVTGMRRAIPVPAWKRPPAIAAMAVLLMAVIGFGGWRAFGAKKPVANAAMSQIAVLYFEDASTRHELGPLADGLTEALIGELQDVQGLHVVSRNGVAPFRGASGLDTIPRALQVGTLVRGSVDLDGSDVQVTVRILGDDAAEIERKTFRMPAANPLAIRDKLADQVSELVRKRVGKEVKLREQREGAANPDAWVLLQRAARTQDRMDSLAREGDSLGVAREWAQADSLAAQAAALDRRWAAPQTLRTTLAYKRSRYYVDDPTASARWIAIGAAHGDSAITLNARDPDALEARGTLRYWKYLSNLESDSARAVALLDSARADLEQATTIRPAQAGAWASLSHLYYRVPDAAKTDIFNAARRAYEADAYLGNADVILSRLFVSSYDLEDFRGAGDWCARGYSRFPANYRFTECRLMMLTTRAVTADSSAVGRAWLYADSAVTLMRASVKPFGRLSSNLYVAAVLARAGLADSARHVAGRSLGNPEVDASHDLALRAAFVYGLLGDTTAAVNQMKQYFTANPAARQTFATDPGWWLRPIENVPAFRQLVGSRP
jgi:TolB-like protein/tRNA A-37 threonylcarbamoyl transferase component Bud32